MQIPFTKDEFFRVFAQYNEAIWPLQWPLNALAVGAFILVFTPVSWRHRFIALTLSGLWAWSAIVYHLAFFRSINPMANVFAAVFLAEAILLAYLGWNGRIQFDLARTALGAASMVLCVYAVAIYPAFSFLVGHQYPQTPTFGVPCPVTIFTLGLLCSVKRPALDALFVVPLIWSAIGSSAAVLFGVYQDLGLLAAGASGLWAISRGERLH